MKIKVVAKGLKLNGQDVPVGTVLDVQGRLPAGWANAIEKVRTERVAVTNPKKDAAKPDDGKKEDAK